MVVQKSLHQTFQLAERKCKKISVSANTTISPHKSKKLKEETEEAQLNVTFTLFNRVCLSFNALLLTACLGFECKLEVPFETATAAATSSSFPTLFFLTKPAFKPLPLGCFTFLSFTGPIDVLDFNFSVSSPISPSSSYNSQKHKHIKIRKTINRA